MHERPLLTGRWTDLLLLNFTVPADLIARLAPSGTEPDLHDGHAYVSIVGFRFQNARLLGIPFPGHTRFDEINLRYYVKRIINGETRRGVIFVREIAPRRAVALIANRIYNENYIVRRMRSNICIANSELSPGDTLEYTWHSRSVPLPFREGIGEGSKKTSYSSRNGAPDWNRLSARVAAPLALPQSGSLHEFIIEHYWGYSLAHDGHTHEYRVAHPPWRVAPADDITWRCQALDFSRPRGAVRGGADPACDMPFAQYLAASPANALIADGSAVQVFRGRRV